MRSEARVIDPNGAMEGPDLECAHQLLGAMVGEAPSPFSLALLLDASRELVAGVHAAMATGRAFIPVGTGSDPSRIGSILLESGCDVILASESTLDQAWRPWLAEQQFTTERRIRLLEDGDNLVLLRRHSPTPFLLPTSVQVGEVGYVIATSGSTGVPKGVAVARSSLRSYSDWYGERFQLQQEDRVAFVSSPAFDMSINPLVAAIDAGCSVYVPDKHTLLHPRRLLDFLETKAITFLNLTPSLARVLVDASEPGGVTRTLPALRLVQFGGEGLEFALARAWRTLAPNGRLFNCYGVAEATVTSFVHEIGDDHLARDGAVPIGVGAPRVGYRIMTSAGTELMGEGSGELVVSGPWVGMGYVGAGRQQGGFEPAAEGIRPREYRTGDHVQRQSDGCIYFLGRKDRQVKVSGGYRVDPSEVEACIRRSDPRIPAVVVIGDKRRGETRLVAVCEMDKTDDLADRVAEIVRANLPRHMWLAKVVVVDTLPRTASGKVSLSQTRERALGVLPDPRNDQHPHEHELRRAWTDVLHDDRDWQHSDEFFSHGGTSLSLMTLVTTLERRTGVSLNVSRMLRDATFAGHLLALDQRPEVTSDAQASPRLSANPLAAAPTGSWNAHEPQRLQARRTSLALVASAVRLPGLDGIDEFSDALKEGRPRFGELLVERKVRMSDRDNDRGTAWRGMFFSSDEVDSFVALSGATAVEQDATDPQQLLWHMVASQALDELPPKLVSAARVGVYLGCGPTFFEGVSPRGGARAPSKFSLAGTTPPFGSARLAFERDLDGPNLVIDSACSSSLVTVHLACEALRSGEIDLAIAGGVQLFHSTWSLELLSAAGIQSPRGVCTPFADDADGYVVGEGAAAIVLASPEFARSLNRSPAAWILATAVNHDGRSPTLTAPRVERQAELYRRTMRLADVQPAEVGFVEAHSTGTAVGDPVEVTGLREVFASTQSVEPLYPLCQ